MTSGFWSYFCLCCSDDEAHKSIKPSENSNLRGNLVRTYSTSIHDDYTLQFDHELGKGGCGVVVVGEQKENHSQYAIKIVSKGAGVIERARLDRELKLLKDVDHTNIVRLFSVYEDTTYMFFVMELCQGGHLGNLLSRQPLKCVDESWGRKLCRQLMSAVAHIHQRGIAHRDIKLQNILIDSTNDRGAQLKLIDFGFGSRFKGALPMRTKCGTPYTTAPEVIRECYDERCDVWSAGVVLYIMLSGKRPFEALEIAGPLRDAGKTSMITNILAGRYHFNHRAWRNVSKEAIAFVRTLLHPDYKTRIRSKAALESAWLRDDTLLSSQTMTLKSSKSFRAVANLVRTPDATEMQRMGMLAVVFGLQPKAAAELRSVFQSMDSDSSGSLSRKEFIRAMNILAPELSAGDVTRIFASIDIDKNEQISYTEFLAATLDPREIDIEELSKAFKLLDEDGNGYITKEEMRHVLAMQYKAANDQEKVAILQNFQRTSHSPAAHSSTTALSSSPSHSGHRTATDLLSVNSHSWRRFRSKEREGGRVPTAEELANFSPFETIEEKLQDVFASADVNHDGVISYQEFLFSMTGFSFYLNSGANSSKQFKNSSQATASSSEAEKPSTPSRSLFKAKEPLTVAVGLESDSMGSAAMDIFPSFERLKSSDGIELMNKIEEASDPSRDAARQFEFKHYNSAVGEELETVKPPNFKGLIGLNNKEYLQKYAYEQIPSSRISSANSEHRQAANDGFYVPKGSSLAFSGHSIETFPRSPHHDTAGDLAAAAASALAADATLETTAEECEAPPRGGFKPSLSTKYSGKEAMLSTAGSTPSPSDRLVSVTMLNKDGVRLGELREGSSKDRSPFISQNGSMKKNKSWDISASDNGDGSIKKNKPREASDEKVSEADLDNESSAMPLFVRLPSFGDEKL